MLGATGRVQVTALIAIYGPRTTVLVGLDDGVYEFSYGCTPDGCQLPDGATEPWICSRKQIKINPRLRIFSPANMRAGQEVAGYKKLWTTTSTTSTPSATPGGLRPRRVPAVHQEHGHLPQPHLGQVPRQAPPRVRGEPRFGLLVEKAGGKTSDGVTGGSVLDVKITQVDQRTALCIGSANEVDRFNSFVLESNQL